MSGRPYLVIITVSIITSILCSAIVLLVLLWDSQKEQRRATEEAVYYWERYLITYYQSQQSWVGINGRLSQDLPRYGTQVSYELQLLAPDKRPIYQSDPSIQGEPDRILLDSGTPIGSMWLEPTPTASVHSRHTAVTGLVAFIVFIATLFTGLYMERRSKEGMTSVLVRIKEVHGKSDNNDGNAHSSSETLAHSMLTSIEGRLFRLENLRKSMVADFAHELRTPLAVIRAQLDNAMLEQTPMPPERIVLLHDEVYRMSKLIKDLQELVLAEAGALHLDYSWVNLSQTVQQVAEILAGEADSCGIRVELILPERMYIYADGARLLQVWINLVGNAIQHARSLVEITLQNSNASILGKIKDDGMGIEEEDIHYLFDRFYRAGHTRSNKHHSPGPGLGLGLAIAKQFVVVHQGTITVQSRWNEGTCFLITLPAMNEPT